MLRVSCICAKAYTKVSYEIASTEKGGHGLPIELKTELNCNVDLKPIFQWLESTMHFDATSRNYDSARELISGIRFPAFNEVPLVERDRLSYDATLLRDLIVVNENLHDENTAAEQITELTAIGHAVLPAGDPIVKEVSPDTVTFAALGDRVRIGDKVTLLRPYKKVKGPGWKRNLLMETGFAKVTAVGKDDVSASLAGGSEVKPGDIVILRSTGAAAAGSKDKNDSGASAD